MYRKLNARFIANLVELLKDNNVEVRSKLIIENEDTLSIVFTANESGYSASVETDSGFALTLMSCDINGKSEVELNNLSLSSFNEMNLHNFILATINYIGNEEEEIEEWLEGLDDLDEFEFDSLDDDDGEDLFIDL